MNSRTRRPYETKTTSKGGALMFGLGLGALIATMAIGVSLAVPFVGPKLEYLPLYARTYYRKVFPPPQYLPTPAATVSVETASSAENSIPPVITPPTLVNEATADAVVPAAANLEPEADANISDVILRDAEAANSLVTDTNTVEAEIITVSESVQLSGIDHQWQTWNNCGPATVTMHMSYFGRPETQADAAEFLKPNKDDKNVSPHELAAYARTVGLEATVRQGGSVELLKRFLSNDFPILAETWLVHDGDGLGHYRLVTGYDDATNQFITYDSLNGQNYTVSYEQFDKDWRVFNHLYIVIYPPERAETVSSILGQDVDETVVYERLVAQTQRQIEANPDDPIAYFNHGDALARLGRYEAAAPAFDQARRLGLHWRRLWYQFTPFETYYAIERYQDVLDLTEATIASTGGSEEAYYYKGLALHATEQAGAEAAFEAAIAYNPNFEPAKDALQELSETGGGQE